VKTATYNKKGGGKVTVEYDENAPCVICGEPVVEASMGGTAVCPSCDCGNCRYCGEKFLTGREATKEECQRVIREHVRQCKVNQNPPEPS